MNISLPLHSIFHSEYRALVVGSSGAIGKAFADALKGDPKCKHVQTLSRKSHQGFDLFNEKSLESFAENCRDSGPYQIIIDATGVLKIDGFGPEKSLSALKHDVLVKNFEINTIGPILMLKYLAPLLAGGPSIYAKLSARVGSISDNKKGGWYGYRAAKAGLNMLLQTAGLELQRRNPNLHIVALQPGTVKSSLSLPFIDSVPGVLEPEESVAGMLNALKNLTPKAGAHFIDYKGQIVEW